MAQQFVLNGRNSDADQFIYRIIGTKYLYQIFDEEKNVLVSPDKWDDPFENLIARSQVALRDGQVRNLRDVGTFYGQCWTLHRASDAMWRIYSGNAESVRIRTTVGRLFESLRGQTSRTSRINCFIGRVRYLTDKGLVGFAHRTLSDGMSPLHLAKTFLVKRSAFRHEREVRLLLCRGDDSSENDGLFRYSIDPHMLIDQIMIDPRLPVLQARKLKQRIKDRTRFRGLIKRSLLYAVPDPMIFRVG